MADKQVKTDVVVEASARGFEETQQKATNLNKNVAESLKSQARGFAEAEKSASKFGEQLSGLQKDFGDKSDRMGKMVESIKSKFEALNKLSFGEATTEVEGLQKQLIEIAKKQAAVGEAMKESGDKGSEEYQALRQYMKALDEEARLTKRSIDAITEAFQKQFREREKQREIEERTKGAFRQGFFQGLTPSISTFMERPGAMQQWMGQLTGSLINRIGRGAWGIGGAAFTGISGLQQGLAVLPGGAALAGQLGTAASNASAALEFERTQLEMAPLLGAEEYMNREVAGVETAGEIKKRLETRPQPRMPEIPPGMEVVQEIGPDGRPQNVIREKQGLLATFTKKLHEGALKRVGTEREKQLYERERNSPFIDMELEAYNRMQEYEEAQGRDKQDLFMAEIGMTGQMGRVGRRLRGLTVQQTAQEGMQFLQAGGGFAGPALRTGALETALAAKTAYGVDLGISGTFQRAARRGGVVGMQGPNEFSSDMLTQSLEDAFKLGLSGSEVPEYLQTMAQAMQAWQTTGIPLNAGAWKTIATGLTEGGIAAPRAMQMTRGFMDYVQGMGQRGVQSGIDLFMLTKLGGFKGGGAKDYELALQKMEQFRFEGKEGLFKGGAFADAMKALLGQFGGDDYMKQGLLRSYAGKMGMQMTPTESQAAYKLLTGVPEEKLTKEEREAIARENKRKEEAGIQMRGTEGGAAGLRAYAEKMIPDTLKKQADIQNQQLAVGRTMLTAVQALEKSATNANTAFTDLASGPLTKFALLMERFTAGLATLVDAWGLGVAQNAKPGPVGTGR